MTRRNIIAAAMAWMAASGAGIAFAQQPAPAPSQVAPPIIRPAPSAPTRFLLPEVPAGGEIPAAARKLNFVLIDIDVEGEFPEFAAKRLELAAPLIGRRVTVADVFDFANKLQQLYVRAGYPLVRVVTPPQELANKARVKVRVIDGYVERIDTDAIGEPVRARVGAVIAPLLHQRHLTQAELERRLLLAGETPGVVLNAVFSGGKEIGGSVLVLTGRYRPVSASLYIDNAQPAVYGTTQVVTSIAENGLAGMGEQILVQFAGFPNEDFTRYYPTRRFLSSVLSLPIGIDGWKLELAATDGKTTPHQSPASFGLLDQSRVKLAFEAIRRRDVELTFNARYEATDERIDFLDFSPPVVQSLDRTRAVRGGLDGIWRLRESGTTVSYGADFSRGLDAFGARNAGDIPPLSRQGAEAVFSKLVGHLEINQALPSDFFAALMAYGQTTFGHPVVTSEQFSFVGPRMLSGFTAGLLPGDTAWVARAELGRPIALALAPANLVVTPYLFAAAAERTVEQPTVLEDRSLHATNYGGGARFNVPSWADHVPDGYAFIEASRGHVNYVVTQAPQDSSRVFMGMLLQY